MPGPRWSPCRDRTEISGWVESEQGNAFARCRLPQGTILYVDRFGNLIMNIDQRLFREVGKDRPFKIPFAPHAWM